MTAAMTQSKERELLQVRSFVRGRAEALDRSETDVREDIALLGELGLIGLGLDGSGLRRMTEVIEDVSSESLAAGFSVWAHRMTLECVNRASGQVRDAFRPDLESGATIGVTAMAAGLKHVAGLGDTPLIATPTVDGIEVSGPIRWASNVFESSLIVLPARSETGETYVALVHAGAPGVSVNPSPDLLALGATASTSLSLERVQIPSTHVISTDLVGFVNEIRPTFFLLQTSLCSGITRAALAECEQLLTGLGKQFESEYRSFAREFDSLRSRLHDYASNVAGVSRHDLIRLRLDGANLAVAATRLESTLRGGAGYVTKSATNRRFREAAFLPIQSPSEGQLRWELAQSE